MFRQACGVFLPAWRDMPDASRLGIENVQLEQVLKARPDLHAPLVTVLGRLQAPVDTTQIAALREASLAEFLALRALVCGAYYLDPLVKAALGYPGQQALTPSRGGFGGEDLVVAMMERPKQYREAG